VAQQQWPVATQHSISQTSGSCAARESGTASQPNASASTAAAARNLSLIVGLMVIPSAISFQWRLPKRNLSLIVGLMVIARCTS
jgi:hypothetical protein